MTERYLAIINRFGVRNQMKKLNEEAYELIEAMEQYEVAREWGDDDNEYKTLRKAVVYETSDVLSLLTQFILKYNISQEEINKAMDEKLERTEERISTGFYE